MDSYCLIIFYSDFKRVVLEIKLSALNIVGKPSTTKPHLRLKSKFCKYMCGLLFMYIKALLIYQIFVYSH